MMTLMHEQPELIHKTLQNITDTMADYSKHLIEDAGLYGVFYGATGLSRSTYMTKEEWEEFVKPYDLQMMEALKPCKIMVHACGLEVNPEYFAHYPIDILHWPESATGNPKLDTAPQWLDKSITPMGGCDERLFGQHKAEEIAALTRNTLKRMKDIPFVLAPDCSLATNTYDEELRAFIEPHIPTIDLLFSLPPVCMLTDCMNREFCLSASCERADRRWEERKDYGGRELLLCAQICSDPELYPAKDRVRRVCGRGQDPFRDRACQTV